MIDFGNGFPTGGAVVARIAGGSVLRRDMVGRFAARTRGGAVVAIGAGDTSAELSVIDGAQWPPSARGNEVTGIAFAGGWNMERWFAHGARVRRTVMAGAAHRQYLRVINPHARPPPLHGAMAFFAQIAGRRVRYKGGFSGQMTVRAGAYDLGVIDSFRQRPPRKKGVTFLAYVRGRDMGRPFLGLGDRSVVACHTSAYDLRMIDAARRAPGEIDMAGVTHIG